MNRPSAFDFSTAKAAVVHQDKPVLYLSNWLTRSYRAALATNRRFIVTSPAGSTATLPLLELLSLPGCAWIGTTTDGRYYDALTGRMQRWEDEDFTPLEEPSDDFLQSPASPQGMIHLRADTLHPASAGTRVGSFCETVFSAVTGAAPAGWGLVEPVSEPWDTGELNNYCRSRAPMPTTVVVLGETEAGTSAPAIAVLSVERTSRGLHERVEMLAGTPEPLGPDELDAFSMSMHQARARHAVLGHGIGYTDLRRPARFTGTTVPACAVFGPGTLGQTDADQALALAGGQGRLIGRAPARSLAVIYPQEPAPGQQHPLAAYAELAAALDR
ncbi:DUF6177 family protein [Arthrobacter monumenti]